MILQCVYAFSVVLFSAINLLCLSQTNVLFYSELPIKLFDYYFHPGIDGLSIVFLYLTGFPCPLCIPYSYGNRRYRVEYSICIICVELLLLLVFTVLDLLSSHIFSEAILIPFSLLIGLRGTRMRRLHAAYLLFFYTVFGSIFMLIGVIAVFNSVGTVNMQILWSMDISMLCGKSIWWSFFLSFAVKIPMVPLHIWLPEAHVESPTEGSVILAGLLLKVGLYGYIRVLLQMFCDYTKYYSPIVMLFAMVSIFFASLSTLRQIDIKRIIAYSSIAHMNICVLGITSCNSLSLSGSVFLMFGHGIVSSGLFFSIGILYDRFGTKMIKYYGGVVNVMPLFSVMFSFFVLGNISMPGTINFVGEFLILCGLYDTYNVLGLYITSFGILLCCIYTMWVYNKIIFGGTPLRLHIRDLNYREFCVLFPLVTLTLVLGLAPNIVFDSVYPSCSYLLLYQIPSSPIPVSSLLANA